MANSNNWGEIYKSTWWGDKAWSANTLFIDSAPPGFGLNLLKGSEDLDNTIDWDRLPDTTDVPTISANTITDPNGGTTAERVDFSANRQARLQQRVTLEASKQYTFSVYAKVNTGTQNFRLRNVTLGDAESKTATTSWTRFSYTFTTTTAGDYDLSLQNNDNTARTLEFWGAMLNEGATAGDYVKTEASVSGSAPTPVYSGFGDSFGGVTAYYSLRQFTEAETLNAIRVRRSSDDTEQDIGFDANGDLDTTALLAFVGSQNLADWSENFGNFSLPSNVTLTSGVTDPFGGTDATELISSTDGWLLRDGLGHIQSGTQYTVSIYARAKTAGVKNGFRFILGSASSSNIETTTTWTRYTATITANGTACGIYRTSLNSFAEIEIYGFQINEGTSAQSYATTSGTYLAGDGAVTTFYDQSGNGNNATNATSTEQPLVVSGGTLVTENGKAAIDFDGVNDGIKSAAINTSFTNLSAFIVKKNEATSGVRSVVRIRPNGAVGTLDGISYEQIGGGAAYGPNTLFEANGNAIQNTSGQGSSVVVQELSTLLFEQSQILAYRDGSLDQTINNISAGTAPIGTCSVNQPLWIGYNFDSNDRAFDGKFQEIILFTSDQSSNRTGIETNINDHFDIYTP